MDRGEREAAVKQLWKLTNPFLENDCFMDRKRMHHSKQRMPRLQKLISGDLKFIDVVDKTLQIPFQKWIRSHMAPNTLIKVRTRIRQQVQKDKLARNAWGGMLCNLFKNVSKEIHNLQRVGERSVIQFVHDAYNKDVHGRIRSREALELIWKPFMTEDLITLRMVIFQFGMLLSSPVRQSMFEEWLTPFMPRMFGLRDVMLPSDKVLEHNHFVNSIDYFMEHVAHCRAPSVPLFKPVLTFRELHYYDSLRSKFLQLPKKERRSTEGLVVHRIVHQSVKSLFQLDYKVCVFLQTCNWYL